MYKGRTSGAGSSLFFGSYAADHNSFAPGGIVFLCNSVGPDYAGIAEQGPDLSLYKFSVLPVNVNLVTASGPQTDPSFQLTGRAGSIDISPAWLCRRHSATPAVYPKFASDWLKDML